MRHFFLPSFLTPPLICSLSGLASAQTEATFPLPEETPQSELNAEAASPPPAPIAPPPAPPAQVQPAPAEPPPAPQPAAASNPYGTPPAPAPLVPGNPYGSVAHRPMATPANPYAHQQSGAALEDAPEDETHWSVGGGILYDGIQSYIGTWANSSYYFRNDNITTSLLFERSLSRHLHILLQPLLSYRKAHMEQPDDSLNEDATVEQLGMALEGGLRWVANPGGVVELGMSHVLTLGYDQLVVENAPNYILPSGGNTDADQLVIGLSNSFIAERELVKRLWLRMGVGLVGAKYASVRITEYVDEVDEETEEEFETERESSDSVFVLGLTPTFGMQLRLTF